MHDNAVVAVSQDVTGVLEHCKANRDGNDRLRGFRKPEEMYHVASIPLALVEILRGQGMDILNDEVALFRFLNDPTYAGFRASTGRV